jgi:hypothetical protein
MKQPVVEMHQGVHVVRDDLIPGGTKARYFEHLFQVHDHVVYASPTFGGAQLGLAYAAREAGKKTTIFVPQRKQPHPRTVEARAAGARVFLVPAGRLNVVQARARLFAKDHGAFLLPFGGDSPEARLAIAEAARTVDGCVGPFDEIWCAAGSGTLTRGLQEAFPGAEHFAVRVGTPPKAGKAHVLDSGLPFEVEEKQAPPFPSCPNYDAKAWRVMQRQIDGTPQRGQRRLFWNVVGPSPTQFAGRGQ